MEKKTYYREISNERIEEFFQIGYKKRYFFQHKIYYLPKCGPDAYKLAYKMSGQTDPKKHWEIVLYATGQVLDGFPPELFSDDDLIIHQQQFGKNGQVATANLILDGDRLYTNVHISDIVQRIPRRRAYKTRIENRFKGWPHMLLNAIMTFAIEKDVRRIYTPNSDLALKNTDPARNVQREMFERIYDKTVTNLFDVKQDGRWWVIDVERNRNRVVLPEKKYETIVSEKTICLCHDIERGLGHLEVDPTFAKLADQTAPAYFEEMLRIEKMMGVNANYNVVGSMMKEYRDRIENDGHCLAFHSYDHIIAENGFNENKDEASDKAIERNLFYYGQLDKCREVDYRLKGYRPPQSRLTYDLSDRRLCYHNFEWFASSVRSLGIETPVMQNRIVKIPIIFDDFKMYNAGVSYAKWEGELLKMIDSNNFVAFSLHDCYGQFWLPHYGELLEKISGIGTFKTLNEVSNKVILSNSMQPPGRPK